MYATRSRVNYQIVTVRLCIAFVSRDAGKIPEHQETSSGRRTMMSRYMEVSVKQRSETHPVDSKLQSYGHRRRGECREQHIRNDFEHGNMDHEEAVVEETSHNKSITAADVRCQPTDACTGEDALPAGVKLR